MYHMKELPNFLRILQNNMSKISTKIFLRVPQNLGLSEKLTEQDITEISNEITRLHISQPYLIYPTFLVIFDFLRIKLKKNCNIRYIKEKKYIKN